MEYIYIIYNVTYVSPLYIVENSLYRIWNRTFTFAISKPTLAFLRFEVLNAPENVPSELMSHATYPLMALREGFRCLQLKDPFNEAVELAKLLVHIQVCIHTFIYSNYSLHIIYRSFTINFPSKSTIHQ